MKTCDESFDDLIFYNRNHEFGAYELRCNYSKRVTMTFFLSVLIMVLSAGLPLLAGILKNRIIIRIQSKDQGYCSFAGVEKKEKQIKLPDPPAPLKKDCIFKPEYVDSLSNPEAGYDPVDKLIDRSDSTISDTVILKNIEIDLVDETDLEEIVESFSIREKPKFQDGDATLIKYIAEHTVYPAEAQERGIQGTVYIRFVVTKSGKIGEVNIMRGVDPIIDIEALRVIKSLPKWEPGKSNGNPVNVWFIIPVIFKLE